MKKNNKFSDNFVTCKYFYGGVNGAAKVHNIQTEMLILISYLFTIKY
jgi:hypothetical protein